MAPAGGKGDQDMSNSRLYAPQLSREEDQPACKSQMPRVSPKNQNGIVPFLSFSAFIVLCYFVFFFFVQLFFPASTQNAMLPVSSSLGP